VSVKQASGRLPLDRCTHWADKYSGGVPEHETADFRAVRGQRRAQPGRTMQAQRSLAGPKGGASRDASGPLAYVESDDVARDFLPRVPDRVASPGRLPQP
jgi:hypothetical protein